MTLDLDNMRHLGVQRLLASCFALLLLATACSDSGGWTQEQRLNAQNVLLALNARNEASQLSNNLGAGSGPREQFNPIVAKMRTALECANAVNDDVLDKIHPELRRYWKDKFIEGLRLRLSNLESTGGNLQAEIRGSGLLDEFGDWFMNNKNQIRVPVPK
jgi:hypothetical protein